MNSRLHTEPVLLANKFFYLKGGAETVFFQERTLLQQRGVTTLDFAMRHPENLASEQEAYFVSHRDYHASHGTLQKLSLAGSFIHSREAVRNILKLARDTRPALAHLHNVYHQLTPSIIPTLKGLGIKVVVTLHDLKLACPAYLMLDCQGEICEQCLGHHYLRPLTTNCQGSRFRGALLAAESLYHFWRKTWEQADLFITPSRFLKDVVCAERLPRDKVVVLPNAIDTDAFTPVPGDKGYLLFFGRLSREKGIETLLRAHATLADQAELVVVGSGPEEERLRQDYPRATFTGYKTGEELRILVANAAMVSIPSEWYENCPMTILEAMALERPVVASNLGGIPELVEHGVTGLLHPHGDEAALGACLRQLLDDPAKRTAMGRVARERILKRHTLARHGDRLLAIYDALLAGDPTRLTEDN
ncbi:MAG: glycosyltransferase family 4 protein [Proteobacteria bacterium]|nr:glycosyltransferase family 4 protein [Pseudomonadota bacterium]MBU1611645.1 glycosyltransferase family 4 protein [Pseudomonadota bacterium]